MRSGSCLQRHTPAPELSSSVRRAIFTSLPVVVALFLLPAIAFASPPDQLWIAGIYDGADGDDIVTLVYETAGVEAATTRPVPLLPRSSEISLVSVPSTIHGLSACQFTRVPPGPLALILNGIRSGLLPTFPAYATFPAYTVTQRLSLSTTCCPRRIEEGSRSRSLDRSSVPRERPL